MKARTGPGVGKAEKLSPNSLRQAAPTLSHGYTGPLSEAARVCLDEQGHRAPVQLTVRGDFSDVFCLSWDGPDRGMKRSWASRNEATEWGACGIAVLLVPRLTDFSVAERAMDGNRFDYWLEAKTGSGPLFQDKGRLEVSGIRKGSEADIRFRVRQKMNQIGLSPHRRLPGLVIVVEFSRPCAEVRNRSSV